MGKTELKCGDCLELMAEIKCSRFVRRQAETAKREDEVTRLNITFCR